MVEQTPQRFYQQEQFITNEPFPQRNETLAAYTNTANPQYSLFTGLRTELCFPGIVGITNPYLLQTQSSGDLNAVYQA